MANLKLVTKVLALAIITSVFACSKKDIDENPTPTEKGHFEVQINNSSTKAGTDPGTDAERKLHNVYLFLYDAADDATAPCVEMHKFTKFEIDNGKVVFSLPKEEVDVATTYDIYAVANASATLALELVKEPTKDVLLALTEAIAEYNKAEYSEAMAEGGVTPLAGFLMSGSVNQNTPAADLDSPTEVNILLSRAVCKYEVTACVSTAFVTKYVNTYNSTIKVLSVTMTNMPTKSLVIKPSALATDLGLLPLIQTIDAGELTETVFPATKPIAMMYSFENGAVPTTNLPTVTVKVEYDFDGIGTDTEPVTLTYQTQVIKGDAAESPTDDKTSYGKLTRNSLYRINLKINGLSAREIVATITVVDWDVAGEQNPEFGG